MVDPNVFAFVREQGYDPEQGIQGFAFGLGIERIAMLRHGIHDIASSSRTTSGSWSSSDAGTGCMAAGVLLSGTRGRRPRDVLALSGTEVERIARVGVPRVDGNQALFRIGEVNSVEQHPDADRLRVCRVALSGADERTIVCGAPNVARDRR